METAGNTVNEIVPASLIVTSNKQFGRSARSSTATSSPQP